MENLINFDENDRQNESPKKQQNNPGLIHPLLVNDRMSLELNNPFDKLEYRATHLEDPFECLEKNQMTISQQKAEAKMENGEKVE